MLVVELEELSSESFAMRDIKYDIAIDGLRTGSYILKSTAIPFLAPVKAEEFEGEAAAPKN